VAKYPAFVGPSYRSQSRIASDDRCVNFYPEKIESPGAKVQWALYPTPGLLMFAEGMTGPIRALYTNNGRVFVIGGSNLYELSVNGIVTLRGTGINDLDGSPATICSNGDGGHQLFITSGSKGYLYDLNTNVFSFVLDGAARGGFVDGFFLALDPQTSTLKISNLENGAVWDPLDVAQRNAGADRWGGMLIAHKEIWLFGSQTTEVFYNSGASFPFVPNPSVFIDGGILAPDSAAMLDNAPAWLGQSRDGGGIVYRANGYTPQRISTHALEYALSTYETLTDAHGWTYQEQGHSFYVLTFPTADRTWVYDAATGAWHERGDWDGSDFVSLPVYGHAYAYGLHLTGDRTSGVVYEMGVCHPSDSSGRVLRRVRRAPHLSSEGGRIVFDKLEVALEVGLGLESGQGSDPTLMLRWSDDGGQTFGNWHETSAGKIGQYKARAIWRKLGQSRDRVFELAVSDPIPWRVLDAYLDVRGGNS
jgi:hypothetical protein